MKTPPTTIETFESLLSKDPVRYSLCLFVGGTKPHSIRALQTIKEICQHYLDGRHSLEVIDIFQDQKAAKKYEILVVPTLLRIDPSPVRRLIGDLSDRERVLRLLSLKGDGRL